MTALVQVPFHGDVLDAVQEDGKVWVSLRRLCENLGVSMEGQLAKLKGKAWATMKDIFMTAPDGKQYTTVTVDLDTLPGWLFSIDARRVKEHVREKLAHYQREAARVLADHFFHRGPQIDPAAIEAMIDRVVTRRLAAIPPAPVLVSATPRFTIAERLRYKGWTPTTAKQRSLIRRLANVLLDLRHQETADVAGGPGGPLIFYGHQLACLDDAIDRVRDELVQKERMQGPNLLSGVAG